MPHVYLPDHNVNMVFLQSGTPGDWALGEFWGPIANETRAWLDHLAMGKPCVLATPQEARATLEATLAIEHSMATGHAGDAAACTTDNGPPQTVASGRTTMAHKTSRRSLLQGAGALVLGAFARPAFAAGYPDRPVRIVVPFAAGGPSDLTARTLSVKLTEALGQTFFVRTRAGAGSNLGTAAVARAAPDGYTLLVTSSAFVVNPRLYKQVPYDPIKDFAPVTELDTSPNVFIATHASGITSIKELVARAKAKPDELSYASAGIGTTPHLAGELLKIVGRHQDHAYSVSRAPVRPCRAC